MQVADWSLAWESSLLDGCRRLAEAAAALSTAMQGLSGDQVRRQAVADTTKVADHGTPTLHAQDAVKNVTASKAQPASIAGSKSGQEAVQQATKGATR